MKTNNNLNFGIGHNFGDGFGMGSPGSHFGSISMRPHGLPTGLMNSHSNLSRLSQGQQINLNSPSGHQHPLMAQMGQQPHNITANHMNLQSMSNVVAKTNGYMTNYLTQPRTSPIASQNNPQNINSNNININNKPPSLKQIQENVPINHKATNTMTNSNNTTAADNLSDCANNSNAATNHSSQHIYVENQMSRKMEMMSLEQNQCNQKEEGGLIMEVDNNNKDEDVIDGFYFDI